MFVPSKVFFTKGVGRHREQLTSFELSLRDAGIEKYNLVQVSSIFPPKCRIINREAGLKELTPGEIAFVVMSKCQSDEPRRLVAASVGCALPSDRSVYGYLSEHHAYGQSERRGEKLGREEGGMEDQREDLPFVQYHPIGNREGRLYYGHRCRRLRAMRGDR
jgi:pyruvoyl-dependent arginine decarboxylase